MSALWKHARRTQLPTSLLSECLPQDTQEVKGVGQAGGEGT